MLRFIVVPDRGILKHGFQIRTGVQREQGERVLRARQGDGIFPELADRARI